MRDAGQDNQFSRGSRPRGRWGTLGGQDDPQRTVRPLLGRIPLAAQKGAAKRPLECSRGRFILLWCFYLHTADFCSFPPGVCFEVEEQAKQ